MSVGERENQNSDLRFEDIDECAWDAQDAGADGRSVILETGQSRIWVDERRGGRKSGFRPISGGERENQNSDLKFEDIDECVWDAQDAGADGRSANLETGGCRI